MVDSTRYQKPWEKEPMPAPVADWRKDWKTEVGSDGFVRLVDWMGDDSSIVQAARISYGEGTKQISTDNGLIRFLLRHMHTGPFEHCIMKFHVRVPMDHWRQWIRHRTASVNEYSTRYSEAIDSMATTDCMAWRKQSNLNKQGSAECFDREDGEWFTIKERQHQKDNREYYKWLLEKGVAREQARKDISVSTYTEAYWTMDLHNMFHFLRLRLDSHAQLEIRAFAKAVAHMVKFCYPVAYEAFEDYILNAMTLTGPEKKILQQLCSGGTPLPMYTKTWLENHQPEDWKKMKRCRERDEFIDKVEHLGLFEGV